MLAKIFCMVLTGFIFFVGSANAAYDLPKIYPDKETKRPSKVDWSHVELFEQKMKLILAENENLPAASPARINDDKNQIFIAFYKGNAYFLDKYSIKVVKNDAKRRSWKQHIFPIGKEINPKTARATFQNFCSDSKGNFNSLGNKNNLAEVKDDADRKFLAECFKVGYYYAFRKEIDTL